MQFTKYQKEIIDKLLLESDKEQIKNGNTTYTLAFQKRRENFITINYTKRALRDLKKMKSILPSI